MTFFVRSSFEITFEASHPSSDFEHQAQVITVRNDYKETVPLQSSPSDLSPITTRFTIVKNSLHGLNTSLNEMESHEAPNNSPSFVKNDLKPLRKNKDSDSDSQNRQIGNTMFNRSCIFNLKFSASHYEAFIET